MKPWTKPVSLVVAWVFSMAQAAPMAYAQAALRPPASENNPSAWGQLASGTLLVQHLPELKAAMRDAVQALPHGEHPVRLPMSRVSNTVVPAIREQLAQAAGRAIGNSTLLDASFEQGETESVLTYRYRGVTGDPRVAGFVVDLVSAAVAPAQAISPGAPSGDIVNIRVENEGTIADALEHAKNLGVITQDLIDRVSRGEFHIHVEIPKTGSFPGTRIYASALGGVGYSVGPDNLIILTPITQTSSGAAIPTTSPRDTGKTFIAGTPAGVTIADDARGRIDTLVRATIGGAFALRQALQVSGGSPPLAEQTDDRGLMERVNAAFELLRRAAQEAHRDANSTVPARYALLGGGWLRDIDPSVRIVFFTGDDPALLSEGDLHLIGSSGNFPWRGEGSPGSHYVKLALVELAKPALGEEGRMEFLKAWISHEAQVLQAGRYVEPSERESRILNEGFAKIRTYAQQQLAARRQAELAKAVVIRPGLQELYPDVYTPEALALLATLVPLSEEVKAVEKERIAKRSERARIGREVQQKRDEGYYGTGEQFRRDEYLADKRQAQLHFLDPDSYIEGTRIKVADARRGNFIGSPIHPKLQTQYVQLTGPAVKPKNPKLLDPSWEIGGAVELDTVLRLGHGILDRIEKGERLDQIEPRSFAEWVALGIIGDLRNVAHQLLSGADSIMEDLEDAAGQLSLMALDNQRSLKLAIARDPLFMRVAKMIMREYKNAGELRIDGELKPQGPLTDAEWDAWKSQLDFTLQIVRARALHLTDRHTKDAEGRFLSASVVDEALFWANNYKTYLDRGLPMGTYLPKIQRAKEAALWDKVFQETELFLMKQDPRVYIGMLKVFVLDEQHQASFEAAEIRAALSQGGSKVEIVELMRQKGEFSSDAEYQQRLKEAQEEDVRFLARTGVDPKKTESRFVILDTGRWDKINSVADENAWDDEWIPPNIEAMTMDYAFMAAQEKRVFQVVNVPDLLGRRALWVGGMEPQIPVGAPEAIELAMQRAVAGAERERDRGAEGKWAAHPKMVHMIRSVWEEKGHAYLDAIQAKATPPTYTQVDEDALRALDPDPKKSPITVRGARNLISVALQMGNAHLRGLQAAALKPADFFESRAVDDVEAAWRNRMKDAQYKLAIAEAQVAHIVARRSEFTDEAAYNQALEKARAQAQQARLNLFLMEDMATGEIRLTILWNWLHKGAKFTEADEETGVRAGDAFTRELFLRLLEEEHQKLLAAAPKNVHEESKTTTLPIARYIAERYVLEDVKFPWYIDLLNISLDQSVEEARRNIDRFIDAWKRDGTRLTENPTFGVDVRTLLGLRPIPDRSGPRPLGWAARLGQVARPMGEPQTSPLTTSPEGPVIIRDPRIDLEDIRAAMARLAPGQVIAFTEEVVRVKTVGPLSELAERAGLHVMHQASEGAILAFVRHVGPGATEATPDTLGITEGELTWEILGLQQLSPQTLDLDVGPLPFTVDIEPPSTRSGTHVGVRFETADAPPHLGGTLILTPDAEATPVDGLRAIIANRAVPRPVRQGYREMASRFGIVPEAVGASREWAADENQLALLAEVEARRRERPPRAKILGNWKGNEPLQPEYLQKLRQPVTKAGSVDVELFVPYTALRDAVKIARKLPFPSSFAIGAENISEVTAQEWRERRGAFTGQISAEMVKKDGARSVLLRHSELVTVIDPSTGRRVRIEGKGETDEMVLQKVRNALEQGLSVTLALGETFDEREAGQTFQVIDRTLTNIYEPLTPEERRRVGIAYEPVYAIGVGAKPATPEETEEVHQFIRVRIAEFAGVEQAAETRILYGGNVNPANIDSLLAQPDIDGALVGGASLDPATFAQIIEAPTRMDKFDKTSIGPTRVLINGVGRIGTNLIRAWLEHPRDIDVVAINDVAFNFKAFGLKSLENLVELLQDELATAPRSTLQGAVFDYGQDPDGTYWVAINNQRLIVTDNPDPAALPSGVLNVDVVLEATGRFTNKEAAAKHLQAGAKHVVITAPATGELQTIAPGVNQDLLDPGQAIHSCGSCTTNAIASPLKVLNDALGIEAFYMDTTHAYTQDQATLDMLRPVAPQRGRAAAENIVPTSTGAASAIGEVIPELKGKGTGIALRVPVKDGSIVGIQMMVSKPTTTEEVNRILREATEGPLKGIMAYSERNLVSQSILGRPESSIIDGKLTDVRANGRLVTVWAWYDNEFGYSNRVLDLVGLLKGASQPPAMAVSNGPVPVIPAEVAEAALAQVGGVDAAITAETAARAASAPEGGYLEHVKALGIKPEDRQTHLALTLGAVADEPSLNPLIGAPLVTPEVAEAYMDVQSPKAVLVHASAFDGVGGGLSQIGQELFEAQLQEVRRIAFQHLKEQADPDLRKLVEQLERDDWKGALQIVVVHPEDDLEEVFNRLAHAIPGNQMTDVSLVGPEEWLREMKGRIESRRLSQHEVTLFALRPGQTSNGGAVVAAVEAVVASGRLPQPVQAKFDVRQEGDLFVMPEFPLTKKVEAVVQEYRELRKAV